jgi:rubrerythrin
LGAQSLQDDRPRKSVQAAGSTGYFGDFFGMILWPIHRLVWADPQRRARKLLEFAEVEASGGRDLVRAAELTKDPVLRARYLVHARDEARHADMFRARGRTLRKEAAGEGKEGLADWMAPGERGMDGLDLSHEKDADLLAFLHLSESAAARDFARYARVIDNDPATRILFQRILRDEDTHKRYTHGELRRIAPRRSRRVLWWARLRRLWKAYLRFATFFAGLIAGVVLTLQYFLLLPPFAWLAKRAARREKTGWIVVGERAGR